MMQSTRKIELIAKRKTFEDLYCILIRSKKEEILAENVGDRKKN